MVRKNRKSKQLSQLAQLKRRVHKPDLKVATANQRPDFYLSYRDLLTIAFEAGIRKDRISTKKLIAEEPDTKELKTFLVAVHRGYEKAQRIVVELLRDLENDNLLAPEEKKHRELLLRKVIDGIAFVILGFKSYVARRLSINDVMSSISINTIDETLKAAKQLNNESRQTFALLTDLTTFIQVGDILRIDFRERKAKVSLIELKTGRVNDVLLEHLERYEPKEESIMLVSSDPQIERGHQDQMKRMLRQAVRIDRIDEILTTDQGIEGPFKLAKPFVFSKNAIEEEHYDDFLEELCRKAKIEEYAAGTINYCLHIGVGFAEDPDDAFKKAYASLNIGIERIYEVPPVGFEEIAAKVHSVVPKLEQMKIVNLLEANLASIFSRPFPIWPMERSNLMLFVERKLVVLIAFDLAFFMYLGKQLGVDMKLSTKKEASENRTEFGHANIPTWGNRSLIMKSKTSETVMFSGMLGRFLVNLESPGYLLNALTDFEIASKDETHSMRSAASVLKKGLQLQ